MISNGARHLYRRLLATGPAEPGEAGFDAADPRLDELLARGLVRRVGQKLLAVPPRTARSDVALATSHQLQGLVRDAIDVEHYLERTLTGTPTATGYGSNDLVEFVHAAAEVSLLSGTLQSQASRSVRSVHTASFPDRRGEPFAVVGPTCEDISAGVHYRVIYSAAFISTAAGRRVVEAAAAQGEEARVHSCPPLKLKIIDESVTLLPVDDTGEGGALLMKTSALTALFTDYFEKLWTESRALGERNDDGRALSPLEKRILLLWADDVADMAIARRLGISERSLRRHVNSVLGKMGARTRAGALGSAMRQGLVT